MAGAIRRDVRYAARLALRSPGSTFSAFVALALGIGATTAIFSVVSHVILRPLPIRDQRSVMRISESGARSEQDLVSMADFLDWKRQLKSFSALALYRSDDQANLNGETTPQRVRIFDCDAGLLPLLGVAPVRGRNFDPAEDEPGRDDVVMLTWPFWQSHFGGQDVIGRKIILDGDPYSIVGILPRDLVLFHPADIWLPVSFDPAMPFNMRGRRWYSALGRLRPGVSGSQANAELSSESAALAAAFPEQNRRVRAEATPLRDYLAGTVRPALYMLLGAGLCVLLIACGNIANLALARASARRRELSIRLALGANPASLFRQLLIENVFLSLSAALAGLGIAAVAIGALRSLPRTHIPNPEDIQLDWRVALFAIAVGVLTGVGFGLAPAIRASMAQVHDTLKQSSGRLTESRREQYVRHAFVFLQAAVATLLLIASVLLLRSYAKATLIDPGFDPDHVIAMHVALSTPRYSVAGAVGRFSRDALAAVRTVPGITDAAITTNLPLMATGGGGAILVAGEAAPKDVWNQDYVQSTQVSPGYFDTMRIRRIAGRDFNDGDGRTSRLVAIVNEAFVRRFLNGQDPIGRKITRISEKSTWREIVGVVADVPQIDIEQKAVPEAFFPVAQLETSWLAIVVRTSGDPLRYPKALRSKVHTVDPLLAVFLPKTMDQVMQDQFHWRIFQTWLLGVFATSAMILACIGIYAVVAYSVSQRTAELGIRMALGAERGEILRRVVRQGAFPAIFGALAGCLCALAISRLIAQLLYGIQATDLTTYVSVVALFLLIAVLASYLPARHVMALEPSRALRYE